MYNIGDLFDELYTDKTANLVVPNNNRAVHQLNNSIKTFDKNLDDVLIQLNDISLFDAKLKQRAIERQQQKNLPTKQESVEEPPKEQELQTQNNEAAGANVNDNNNLGNNENILDDINDFLSTVPDSADVGLNDGFNDNIQSLLMENNPYDDPNNNGNMNFDFQNNDNNVQNINNDGNNNSNNNNNSNGDVNMEFDNNIFDEIDSMLNI